MAGKLCPHCGEQTLFLKPFGRECSRCHFRMDISPHNGTGGKGTKCPNCNKFTVRNNKCTNCGAIFTPPRKKEYKKGI